jgi:hypothetical protein
MPAVFTTILKKIPPNLQSELSNFSCKIYLIRNLLLCKTLRSSSAKNAKIVIIINKRHKYIYFFELTLTFINNFK